MLIFFVEQYFLFVKHMLSNNHFYQLESVVERGNKKTNVS